MTEIAIAVRQAGGDLSLDSAGRLIARGLRPALVAKVRTQKAAIIAGLKRQAELEAAGVDPEGIRAVEDLADTFDAEVIAVGPAPPEPAPIRAKRPRRIPQALEPGEEVRLVEGGPWFRVVRTTPTAAYLKPTYSEPVQAEFPNGQASRARTGGKVIPVSPTSFVVERRR